MTVGWCVYDSELASAGHVDAVRRLRPSMVRWFCSIDRYVKGAAVNFDWEATFGEAFESLARVGARLVVQLQMKRPDWACGDPGNSVGAQSWRPARCGWPQDPDSTWVPFVRRLAAAVDAHGFERPTLWGAWNEPDWRIDWPWAPRPKYANPLAPTDEWQWGQWLWWPMPPLPPFGWSGGHARLSELRLKLPELTWTSDGVGGSPEWLSLTAKDPTVSVIDVHGYYDVRVADLLKFTTMIVEEFDRARPDRLPIIVGEWGENANGTPFSPAWQARSKILVDELDRIYPGRVLGVCAHLQGARDGTTYPALWQVL